MTIKERLMLIHELNERNEKSIARFLREGDADSVSAVVKRCRKIKREADAIEATINGRRNGNDV